MRYFHTSTIIRRRYNRIESLKNDDDRWVTSTQELEQLEVNYYQKLYSMDDVPGVVETLPSQGFVELTQEERRALSKPFSGVEVEEAICSIGRFKAPGPDGYQPIFYQDCWEVVGDSVVQFALEFFSTWNLPAAMNDVLVVIIGKVLKPEKITQFRPISLCNVLFKTITKIMVLRLKRLIAKLIGPTQSSFIPGRLSMDNIVVVQEAVHSIRWKNGEEDGCS